MLMIMLMIMPRSSSRQTIENQPVVTGTVPDESSDAEPMSHDYSLVNPGGRASWARWVTETPKLRSLRRSRAIAVVQAPVILRQGRRLRRETPRLLDALALRSARAFERDVRRILDRTERAHPHAVVLMSSLPAFFRFRLLPEPLRGTLYRHSQALESAARALVSRTDRAHMSPPPPPYTEGFFASDDFHPSALGYRDWADFAIEDAALGGMMELL